MIRTLIGAVHAVAVALFVLVLSTGLLTIPAFFLWLALCAAGDQAVVWALWSGGGRKGLTPNRGWF
jgi:hypothetical protein